MRTEIVSDKNLTTNDIVIAFMGPTGSGKSRLIDCLVDDPSKVRASSGLKSCTQDIEATRLIGHKEYGNRIVLVDTPGFDDTTRSDLQILQMIANWLKTTYQGNVTLAGIFYLHRIMDNRMSGTPHRNFRMFTELCGADAAKKVVLVTTMWDRVPAKVGEDRERQLKSTFWSAMLKKGTITARSDNQSTTVWTFVLPLLEAHEHRECLLLQQELVQLKIRLNETRAAKCIHTSLQTSIDTNQKNLASMQSEGGLSQRADTNARRLEDLQAEIEETIKQLDELKIPISRRVVLFFKKPKSSSILQQVQ